MNIKKANAESLKNFIFILTAVRNRRRRPGHFCPDWTSVDEWRRRLSRPPNVAGGLRGGTQDCKSWQQRRQRLHQQHQQLFAGNCFTVNVRKLTSETYEKRTLYTVFRRLKKLV